MMNEIVHTDLTPPTKQKAVKEPKPKKEKAEKVATPVEAIGGEPAPKKERAPRTDYGYAPNAVIEIVKDKDNAYRGKRKEWFDKVQAAQGQTAAQFLDANKGDDAPRGWLRFFVQDGTVALVKSETAPPEQAAA
jgi:hypothetical protein